MNDARLRKDRPSVNRTSPILSRPALSSLRTLAGVGALALCLAAPQGASANGEAGEIAQGPGHCNVPCDPFRPPQIQACAPLARAEVAPYKARLTSEYSSVW